MNIVRGGPGLGGIQPAQSDYFQATKGGGHGDYHLFVIAPSSIQEIVDLTCHAFDVADTYRIPVMMMGDGMLGQMMEPISFGEIKRADLPEKTWATTGTQMKRERNIINSLFMAPEELEDLIRERQKRYDIIERDEVMVEEIDVDGADIVVTAYGTIARVVKNAKIIAEQQGIKVGIIRPITLWPFPKQAFAKAAASKKPVLCVEMSMGQMVEDVRLAVNGAVPVHFYGRTGGVVPAPEDIAAEIKKITGGDR